jgi:hypothetical protein
MLISRSRKLLFVHIQKTGGTSIAAALRRAIPDVTEILCAHDHARWAREHLGEDYDELFKFAFVRNPWERLVSWYTMITGVGKEHAATHQNGLWNYVFSQSATFEEFIVKCTETIDDGLGRRSFVYNQLDYLTGDDGNLIVDFVGRYENLELDFQRLTASQGLGLVVLPRLNTSRHQHYSDYYTPLTRDIVAERFARDIAAFGYSFEQRSVK